ncbi:hypothetical protein P0082_11825 [Candidatus Haliotispira prima]|uniref:Uncharacterized protein n=1 Tax=Candidatus Haliotispira prima TaxID=3034016 RepID=A0ABY8MGY3_9SPIO|nr:hypothetical protein P0082_11825 [Candidatus Haliotispira prima]
MSSNPAVTDMGAVIRPATEAVPTQTGAQAGKGYVKLSIDAGSTRKFSISQHYDSDFENGGFTLADVLAPNTNYKLYLFTPSTIDLGQTRIKGGEIQGDRIEIPFTTASLPAAGDAVWSNKLAAREYVLSLNEYHFMESQTGVFVAYLWSSSIPVLMETSSGVLGNNHGVGNYVDSTATPTTNFYYNSGLIPGYVSTVSQYTYIISADKLASPTLRINTKVAVSLTLQPTVSYNTPISRY